MSAQPRLPSAWLLVVTLACLALGLGLADPGTVHADTAAGTPPAPATAPAQPLPNATELLKLPPIPNERCLHCHADANKKTAVREDGSEIDIYVDPGQFEQSVHGHQPCVGCHNSIRRAAHEIPLPKSIGCVQCHLKMAEAQKDTDPPKYKRLAVVLDQITGYMASVHARPSLLDQSRTNATCYDCHDAHRIGTIGSAARAEHRRRNPEVCGRCHPEQRDQYVKSVHGRAALDRGNDKSAVCSDCHTPHNIDSPDQDRVKLTITANCGSCHQQQVQTYRASYHGQIIRLGYTHTAKCYDCHGNHGILEVKDPAARVHPNHRLETCRQCHTEAPPGFLGFHAHGDPNDFARFPEMWIAVRFMHLLIGGVFLFFWTHAILWIYREWRERRAGRSDRPDPTHPPQVYFRRVSLGWRLIHGGVALSVMTLVLTGTAVLFAEQPWAQYIMHLIGGPKVAAIAHRVAAVTLIGIFVGHLAGVTWNIARTRGRFQWFGPDSMVPNRQDFRDIRDMFKWFLGRGPRPRFGRWTYWEKFDYWAPFWGMTVVGTSGLMLWFPQVTAAWLPGWVFNIATIIHAEEAVLAAVFIFTVHYFNSHFRPEKFPMDIVMVTGAVPLEEFRQDHPHEYERLAASGELERWLTRPPSARAQRIGRKITGWLIVVGLVLAGLVVTGYVGWIVDSG